MEEKSIPVMIDDRKDFGEFLMTRVAYFYVEAVDVPQEIPIDYQNFGIPMIPLEFSGAIHKPVGMGERFETPDQIEELYRAVERHESFYVDSDNLWVPSGLFEKTPERGDVYRVPYCLFRKLYLLCRDDATLEADISQFSDDDGPLMFSGIETDAFEQWTAGIVESVKAAYPKNESLKLEWRE